jgi:hypothetical protein
MTIWQTIVIAMQTSSNALDSEIQSLTSEIERLERSLSTWESALILFIALTAIAAVLVFVAEFGSRKLNRRLQEVKSTLIEAKDRQLQSDLKDKEVAIGDAKKEAAVAQRDAGMAYQHAGEANRLAGEANARAETERVERLKLEAQVQPRELTLVQQNEIGVTLRRRYAGSHVSVRSYSLDGEGWRLGQQLIAALRSGGILVTDSTNNLTVYGGPLLTGIRVSGPQRARELVEALTNVLHSEGGLDVSPPNPNLSPDNEMVEVMIGVKPFVTAKRNSASNKQ